MCEGGKKDVLKGRQDRGLFKVRRIKISRKILFIKKSGILQEEVSRDLRNRVDHFGIYFLFFFFLHFSSRTIPDVIVSLLTQR